MTVFALSHRERENAPARCGIHCNIYFDRGPPVSTKLCSVPVIVIKCECHTEILVGGNVLSHGACPLLTQCLFTRCVPVADKLFSHGMYPLMTNFSSQGVCIFRHKLLCTQYAPVANARNHSIKPACSRQKHYI